MRALLDTVLFYDGTTWTKLDSGVVRDLRAVWLNGRSDVLLAGQGATILRRRPQR